MDKKLRFRVISVPCVRRANFSVSKQKFGRDNQVETKESRSTGARGSWCSDSGRGLPTATDSKRWSGPVRSRRRHLSPVFHASLAPSSKKCGLLLHMMSPKSPSLDYPPCSPPNPAILAYTCSLKKSETKTKSETGDSRLERVIRTQQNPPRPTYLLPTAIVVAQHSQIFLPSFLRKKNKRMTQHMAL